MGWLRPVSAGVGGMIVAIAVASCQSPTQIVLTVRTDVPCADVQGSTVTVGRVGEVETKPHATDALVCDGVDGNGYFGSVVLVPAGDADGEVAMKIVTGVHKPADECILGNGGYGLGCIVARRALRFIAHETLRVNVITRSSCNGVSCPETETCVKGTCVTAVIPDPAVCGSPDGCSEEVLLQAVEPGAGPDAGPGADAGRDAAPACTLPTLETCNGLDDDCDGLIDQGVPGLESDPKNCGVCFRACPVGQLCNAGVCFPTCAGLAEGALCVTNQECCSQQCLGARGCAALTCKSGVKDGTESDIDCGGSGCPTCVAGRTCLQPTDCTSAVCLGGACQ